MLGLGEASQEPEWTAKEDGKKWRVRVWGSEREGRAVGMRWRRYVEVQKKADPNKLAVIKGTTHRVLYTTHLNEGAFLFVCVVCSWWDGLDTKATPEDDESQPWELILVQHHWHISPKAPKMGCAAINFYCYCLLPPDIVYPWHSSIQEDQHVPWLHMAHHILGIYSQSFTSHKHWADRNFLSRTNLGIWEESFSHYTWDSSLIVSEIRTTRGQGPTTPVTKIAILWWRLVLDPK